MAPPNGAPPRSSGVSWPGRALEGHPQSRRRGVNTTAIGILADDLTGASDIGVQFSRAGGAVLAIVSLDNLPRPLEKDWDVVVVNTGTRNVPPEDSRAPVAAALAYLRSQGVPLVYKKVDSTLRGNWIPELEELFSRGVERVYLAPAFPLNGRTVEDGVLKVGGVPVHETDVGHDRLSPVATGDLAAMLGGRFGPPGYLPLAALREGAGPLALRLDDAELARALVVVCDAAEQADLGTLAEVLLPRLPGPVAMGSAGMARELAARMPLGNSGRRPEPPPRTGRVMVVAGSRSEATREQVAKLLESGTIEQVRIESSAADGPWDVHRETAAAAGIVARLAGGSTGATALVTLGEESAPSAEEDRRRSARLNGLVGAVVRQIAAKLPLRGLVLTGGDIAAAALKALGATGIRLGPEVLPGIPLGWLVGGTSEGLPVVTKAGGFGAPDALEVAARALTQGARTAAGGSAAP